MTVQCGGQYHKLLLERGSPESEARLARSLASCSRPGAYEAKDTFTVAYNNVAPFVRAGSAMVGLVSSPPLLLQGGAEPKIVTEFAAKFGLQLTYLDARFTWGSFVASTQRWNGVVGHVAYGEADLGLTNIDITSARHGVVDYSAPVWSNEGVIISGKPRPASPLLNIVTVFSPVTWAAIALACTASFLLTLLLDTASASMFKEKKTKPTTLAFDLYADLLGEIKNINPKNDNLRSRAFFLFVFSVFCLFVIGFFLKVGPTHQTSPHTVAKLSWRSPCISLSDWSLMVTWPVNSSSNQTDQDYQMSNHVLLISNTSSPPRV